MLWIQSRVDYINNLPQILSKTVQQQQAQPSLQHPSKGLNSSKLEHHLVQQPSRWWAYQGPTFTIRYQCAMSEVSDWSRWPRTGRDTGPQFRVVTCFNEETKLSRWVTYVALGNRTWTVHRSDVSPHFLNQRPRGKINGYRLLALVLLRILFKPLNTYTFFIVSLLSLKQTFLSSISSKHSLFCFQNSNLQTSTHSKVWFLLTDCSCFMIPLPITCYNCSETVYVFCILGFLHFHFPCFTLRISVFLGFLGRVFVFFWTLIFFLSLLSF